MATEQDELPVIQGEEVKYKSYKKKYMKIRAKFNETMNSNNTQWEAEQKLMKTARRLEEELDQLRDLLVDVNESKANPAHLRLNYRSSDRKEDDLLTSLGVKNLPPSDLDILNDAKYSPESAAAVLAEAKKELASNTITDSDFEALAKSVRPYLVQGISLSYLETAVPHTKLAEISTTDLPTEVGEDFPVGYLTPEHETEYLERIDTELDGRSVGSHPIRGPTNLHAARDNPMSALNWLRVNQPGVFLQDAEAQEKAQQLKRGSHDGGSEKPGRRKRGSIQELEDLLPAPVQETPTISGRGKRKRAVDDEAYNPKGGRRKSRKQEQD